MYYHNEDSQVRFKSSSRTALEKYRTHPAQLQKDRDSEYQKFLFHLSPYVPKLTRNEGKEIKGKNFSFIQSSPGNKIQKSLTSRAAFDAFTQKQEFFSDSDSEQTSSEQESDSNEREILSSLRQSPFKQKFQEDFIEDFTKRLKANDKLAKEKVAHEIRQIKKYADINEDDLTFQVKHPSGSEVDSSPTYPHPRSKFTSKRDNKSFLYRGQEYDDEAIHRPIRARGTKSSITLSGHMSNYTKNSPYISITRDLDVATFYAMMYASKSGKKSAKIFVIDKTRLLNLKKHFDIRNSAHFNDEFRPKLIKKLRDPVKNQGFSFRAILNGSKDKEVVVKPESESRAEIPCDMILKVFIVEEVPKEAAEFNYRVASATKEEYEAIKSKMIAKKKESESKDVLKHLEEIRAGKAFAKCYLYDKKKWEKFVGKTDRKTQTLSSNDSLINKYFVYRSIDSVRPPSIQTNSKLIAQIYEALSKDHEEKLQPLLEKISLDLEISSSGKWNCVHFAAYFNAVKCLEHILTVADSKEELKPLIDSRTGNEGWTPLMIKKFGIFSI